MRILVVGAGSVGGYFGGRLVAAGRDVTFLVRDKRAGQLRRDGLRIVSPHGDLTIVPKLVSAGQIDAPYDLILLSVKAYGLDGAIEDFAPAVGPETMILPVLNGMRHLDTLGARFGEGAVLGGLSHISADLDSEGRVLQLGTLQDLVYGELNGTVTPRIQALKAVLSDAGFDDERSENIVELLWEKWVMLASGASITCLFRSSIGEVAALPEGRQTASAIVDECAAIARAAGHPVSDAALNLTRDRATRQNSPFTASMYRDLQKGAPVEVDAIVADLLGRGRLHGVEAPLLTAAYVHLAVYQAKVDAARAT